MIKTIECPICDDLLTIDTQAPNTKCGNCGCRITMQPSSTVSTQCHSCNGLFTTTAMKSDLEEFDCTLCGATHYADLSDGGWHSCLKEDQEDD